MKYLSFCLMLPPDTNNNGAEVTETAIHKIKMLESAAVSIAPIADIESNEYTDADALLSFNAMAEKKNNTLINTRAAYEKWSAENEPANKSWGK